MPDEAYQQMQDIHRRSMRQLDDEIRSLTHLTAQRPAANESKAVWQTYLQHRQRRREAIQQREHWSQRADQLTVPTSVETATPTNPRAASTEDGS